MAVASLGGRELNPIKLRQMGNQVARGGEGANKVKKSDWATEAMSSGTGCLGLKEVIGVTFL
jgi:hypothetical protein